MLRILTFVKSLSSRLSIRVSFLKISSIPDITESDTTEKKKKTLENKKIFIVTSYKRMVSDVTRFPIAGRDLENSRQINTATNINL